MRKQMIIVLAMVAGLAACESDVTGPATSTSDAIAPVLNQSNPRKPLVGDDAITAGDNTSGTQSPANDGARPNKPGY